MSIRTFLLIAFLAFVYGYVSNDDYCTQSAKTIAECAK